MDVVKWDIQVSISPIHLTLRLSYSMVESAVTYELCANIHYMDNIYSLDVSSPCLIWGSS